MNNMHTVVNEPTWGILVSIYYFLVAVSSGTMMVALVTELCFGKIAGYSLKKASLFSLFILIFAPVILIAELMQPMRFLYLLNPANFNITSPLAWGGIILTVYGLMLILFIQKQGWFKSAPAAAVSETAATMKRQCNVFHVFLLAVAAILAFLPSIELLVVPARVFWRSELLSVYFLTTTLLAGCAVLAILSTKGEQSENVKNFIPAMKGLIVFSIIWVIIRSIGLATGGIEEMMACKVWWASMEFTLGEIIVGLVIPFVLLSMSNLQNSYRFMRLASIFVLIGVFAMRYVVIVVGNAAILP